MKTNRSRFFSFCTAIFSIILLFGFVSALPGSAVSAKSAAKVPTLSEAGGLPSYLTATAIPNPVTYGVAVEFDATVTGASDTPTGTVDFLDGTTILGTATLSEGTAQLYYTGLAPGDNPIVAIYNGDSNYDFSVNVIHVSVTKASSATYVDITSFSSVYGDPVKISATVATVAPSSGIPTGSVDFYSDGSYLGSGILSSQTTSFTTSSLPAGNHSITAHYNGDDNYNASTSNSYPHYVIPADSSTTISSNKNPCSENETVTFTATVDAPGATGTVTFYEYMTLLGTAQLKPDGTAQFSKQFPPGTHYVRAAYNGDSNYLTSISSLLPQQVNPSLVYTIRYIDAMTGRPIAPETTGTGSPGQTITADSIPINGFVALSLASQSIVLTDSGTNTITFSYLSVQALLIIASFPLILCLILLLSAAFVFRR